MAKQRRLAADSQAVWRPLVASAQILKAQELVVHREAAHSTDICQGFDQALLLVCQDDKCFGLSTATFSSWPTSCAQAGIMQLFYTMPPSDARLPQASACFDTVLLRCCQAVLLRLMTTFKQRAF